jgi:hypothetical protein
LASRCDVDRKVSSESPCKTAMPGSDRFDGRTTWPAGPGGSGRAFGARERGLNPASTDPRTVSWGGRCKWPVARAIGRPRWGSTFRVIRRDPLIARPLRHKLAGIIDRLRFFNETSRTKRPTPLLEGGVGERLCRWGRKPAIRDATASVRSRFRRPLAPTPRAGLRRT